jgi:transposase
MSVEDWAEIRRLHRSEEMPIKAIARVMGVGRNTVRRALAAEGPPKYHRVPRGSKVDAVEPRIRELLRAYPRMPATVIAERVGWGHGITSSKTVSVSCGRCICRRIQRGEPSMWLGSWRSAICGFRPWTFRWGAVSSGGRRCW